MKNTVTSGMGGDAWRTLVYQRSREQRCRCCGEFLCSMDHLHAAAERLEESLQLCGRCQLTLSVRLMQVSGVRCQVLGDDDKRRGGAA